MAGTVFNLKAFVGDKPVWKSFTAWGVAVYFGLTAVLDEACAQGVLATGTCITAVGWADSIGKFLVIVGLRRASNK